MFSLVVYIGSDSFVLMIVSSRSCAVLVDSCSLGSDPCVLRCRAWTCKTLHLDRKPENHTKVFEGIRRYTKVYEGIRRYTKVYEGKRRYTKVYEGIRRYTKVYEGMRRYTNVYEGTHTKVAFAIISCNSFATLIDVNATLMRH